MSSARFMRKTTFRPAAYMLLALLLILRLGPTWTTPAPHAPPGQHVSTPGKAHVSGAAITVARRAAVRYETTADGPSPPSSHDLIHVGWPAPTQAPPPRPGLLLVRRTPAPPPPARGPPLSIA